LSVRVSLSMSVTEFIRRSEAKEEYSHPNMQESILAMYVRIYFQG